MNQAQKLCSALFIVCLAAALFAPSPTPPAAKPAAEPPENAPVALTLDTFRRR